MVESWIDRPPLWLSGDGPDAEVAVGCVGSLVRSLVEYPFPERSSDEEKAQVENRVLSVLDNANLSAHGQYCSLLALDPIETRFLQERQLLTTPHVHASGPRGVYVSEDQSMSVMVNEIDHVRIQVLASGRRLEDVWSRLNLIDDMLAGSMHYAFDERLGYLTAGLDSVGSGLRLTVILHLPALAAGSRVTALRQRLAEEWHILDGLWGSVTEGLGDLYTLTNRATLGRSEEEIMYHLNQTAGDIIAAENEARAALLKDSLRSVEDRVWRAAGTAQSSRLMSFDDAANVLSSLRLGTATSLLTAPTRRELNEVLFGSQRAHLEMRKGEACDDLTLDADRADLFRRHFQ